MKVAVAALLLSLLLVPLACPSMLVKEEINENQICKCQNHNVTNNIPLITNFSNVDVKNGNNNVVFKLRMLLNIRA